MNRRNMIPQSDRLIIEALKRASTMTISFTTDDGVSVSFSPRCTKKMAHDIALAVQTSLIDDWEINITNEYK